MVIRFLEIAQIEFDETIEYYNSESPGLGDSFLLDTLNTIERIRLFPNAWHPFSNITRRCQLRHFPYGIIYQIVDTDVLVVAVANLHRTPDTALRLEKLFGMEAQFWLNLQLAWDLYHVTHSSTAKGIKKIKRLPALAHV